MNQHLDPKQVRKRMLVFYFAAGVNVLMAFWVWSAGAGQTAWGTLSLVMLVFLAFAGLNYYMARRLGKFLRRQTGPASGNREALPSAKKVE